MTEIIDGVPQPVNVSEKYVKATYFETAGSGVTSGTITKPAGNKPEVAFVLDEWGTDTDGLVSTMSNGKPTFKSPVDAGGNNITTTLNISGEYAFSGTPSPAGDHAVIFVYKCYLKNFNVAEALFESESIDFEASGSIATHAAVADAHHAVYTHPNHSGDVTSVADGAQTIATAVVTLAKMADMATASLLGRNTAGAGVPEVLAKATALSLLNVADGADVTGSNAPKAHTASHTNGTDDIQSATAAQKGLATAAQITKLDGIEALAEVNDVYASAAEIVTGTEAAKVIAPDQLALSTALFASMVYPIGCIYQSVVSTSPATLFGMGTWIAFGAGKVLVGIDGTTEFLTVEQTGGEKTHQLSIEEMASHTHTLTTGTESADHSHTLTTGTESADHSHTGSGTSSGQSATHAHGIAGPSAFGSAGGYEWVLGTDTKRTSGNANGDHSHTYSFTTSGRNQGHTHSGTSSGKSATHTHSGTSSSVGSNTAHNNLQPYIVVYRWKRTA